MRRLCALLFLLVFCMGCAGEGTQEQWDELRKDIRGDNMKMRSNFSGTDLTDDRPVRANQTHSD